MSSIRVDHALGAAPDRRAAELLALDEDQWFDRKSIRVQPAGLAHTLVAFANAEGGTVVIGLSRGVVEDVDSQPARVNELSQAAINFTEPPVRSHVQRMPVETPDGDRTLLVIHVAPGERVHRTTSGDCYLRVGDESRRLTYAQERELLFDRGPAQFDGEPAREAKVEDLDSAGLESYAAAIGHPDVSRVLNSRDLLSRDGLVTNAAYLLFAERPQLLFPQALIRVIRYTANERGTGSRQTIAEGQDLRVEGSIPMAINEAQQLIEGLVPQRRTLGLQGRFVSQPIVPRDAWLEGLVNAVVHRSYSLGGDHIRVEIFPNRIEIESPGRFPGLVDVENPLKIARFARNPRIARVCADLRITQELGEGIKRIFEEMRRSGLEDPLYRQTSGSVRLLLASTPRLDPQIARRLPHGSQSVLRVLHQSTDRRLSTGDIAELLSISRPTAVRRLGALREAGLVDWHGKSTKDPRAYWTATDGE